MKFATIDATSPDQVFAHSASLLEAVSDGHVWTAVAVVRGPVVVLGAWQHPALTLHPSSRLPLVRRATSGTAGFVSDQALVLSLALPSMHSLVHDTHPGTLLNRNVRGWLNGLTSVGATAQYYGREWVAVRHRPCGLLGLEVDARGHVLLEMLLGWETSIALPDEDRSLLDRSVDRWLGKTPVSLRESVSSHRRETPLEVANAIVTRAAERWSQPLEPARIESNSRREQDVPHAVGEAVRCEIGTIAAFASATDDVWIGGDVLMSSVTRNRLRESFMQGRSARECLSPDDVLFGALSDDWDMAWRLRAR